MKKRIFACLLAALTTLSLASCGNDETSSTAGSDPEITPASSDGSSSSEESASAESTQGYTPNFDEEPYTVHFQYVVSAEGTGMQGVRDAINELTLSEMNMEVDLIPLTMGAWTTNLSMMLAANEPLDLFLCGSGNFSTFIQSGYLRNWADYLDYLPGVVETLGDDLEAGYVGDFLVGFTQMKERGYQAGLVARADIMDELGISPDDFAVTTEDYSTYDQFTQLFAAVHEAYPDMTVNGGTQALASQLTFFNDGLGDNFGVLPDFGQTTEIVNWFETDQCLTFCNLSRDWFEAGYYSADAATNQDSGETLMRAGNLFSYFTAIKPNTDVEKRTQTGYKVYVIPAAETVFTSSGSVNGLVYSLANASEDPVKAAAFYNWAFTSPEFNDTINWGVEGVDWVEDENGQAAYPEGIDASNVGYHQDYGWAYLNQFCAHAWQGNDPDIWEQYEEFNANMLRSKAFGLTFDSTEVADQIAACTAVFDQYDNDLFWGTADPETTLPVFNEALYAAGLQDILDAKQAQLDAFLASAE